MKYWLDTEFIERPNTIQLISIGIVAEDGREYYAVHTECDCTHADDWVKENVLIKMPQYNKSYNDLRSNGGDGERYGIKTIESIRKEIYFFCGQNNNAVEQCEFYGYYADYDWVIFCWIFGKMINLPKGFPKYCRDLKQYYDDKQKSYFKQTGLELKTMDIYPKQENEHNALDDAKWNKSLHDFLQLGL